MNGITVGTVIAVKKLWWLKLNTKPLNAGALDGTVFPHVITFAYIVKNKTYHKRKWIGPGMNCPHDGERVIVHYDENKPSRCRIKMNM